LAEGVCPDGPLTGFFLIDTYRRPVFFRKLQTIKKAVPWEDFRADICVPSCKDHAVAGQASKQPHSGTHLGTSAAPRSLSQTQIAEGGIDRGSLKLHRIENSLGSRRLVTLQTSGPRDNRARGAGSYILRYRDPMLRTRYSLTRVPNGTLRLSN
jgi:hypothetical protein